MRRNALHAIHDEFGCALRNGQTLANEILRQWVNHECEAANIAEIAGRVQHARRDVEFVQNLFKIVIRDFSFWPAERGENHGF